MLFPFSLRSLIFKVVLASLLLTSTVIGEPAHVHLAEDGRLSYAIDARGNKILDFSHCGYAGAIQPIPDVPARVMLRPTGVDDTKLIQAAVDHVTSLPLQSSGFRGAVLLAGTEFKVSGQIRVQASGVVLRGFGASEPGTTLRATGTGRRALIRIEYSGRLGGSDAEGRNVIDDFVPVGATQLRLDSVDGLKVGDQVLVVRPSSTEWIKLMGGDHLGWRLGSRDLRWQRTVTKIDGKLIHFDAPLTTSHERRRGSAKAFKLGQSSHIDHVGIEDLQLVSDYDGNNKHDEEHAWFGVTMQSVKDAWVRRVQFRHFVGGAVMQGDDVCRVTVRDVASLEPVSEVGGYRRHTFFTQGQQCLFLRCWSENGLHDFAVGHCAAGPNAFVHCYAKNALGDSGPIESCATGVLYDNVRIDGNDLNLMNRWNMPPKTGWSAINCVLWQCQAANMRCERPPIGNNWALGIWTTPSGDGGFENVSEFIKPISLFQQQVRERLGQDAAEQVGPFLLNPVSATNPTLDQAREFTHQSNESARQLIDLIRKHWKERPRVSDESIPTLMTESKHASSGAQPSSRLAITNGWLTANRKLLTGDYYTPAWWRGDLQRTGAKAMGPAITRFAPGRNGTGLTDDLGEVAQYMTDTNIVGYDHHHGLWYDRRRDDHLMVRRADGEVVPPFYEQPFARSGKGTAWDGLSRYDLSRPNPWYWSRLQEFADLGEQNGFVLFHHNYFQHNILEAGAHWADSPWRPANNVNEMGLPEPPPYVGDKRIFLAEQFYDVSDAKLRELHRNYIRQCLNNFANQHNVIQLTSGEFTGPLSFMQFWLDTIAEWEQETERNVILGLSCTKDVQDAILSDPIRSKYVDVIDIRYWTYTADGQLYAPPGGKNLSPRQHLRQLKPASTSSDSIVRSVREYRTRFPDKAVTYYANIYCRAKRNGWAILMGGGSLPNVPALPEELSQAIARMQPSDRLNLRASQWCLADGDREFLIYSNRESRSQIQLPSEAEYEWTTVNAKSGQDFVHADNGLIPVKAGPTIVWARDASP